MKIAIVVQGRFHAFHLARALLDRGSDVTVLTNYPKWAAARFGLPGDRVRSYWPHGVLTRLVSRLDPGSTWRGGEVQAFRISGWKRASRQLKAQETRRPHHADEKRRGKYRRTGNHRDSCPPLRHVEIVVHKVRNAFHLHGSSNNDCCHEYCINN